MSNKEVKVTLTTNAAGVTSAAVEDVSFVKGVIGSVTDLFSSSEAHIGTGATVGKACLLAGAVYGTAYLKDGEFNLNPFA